MTETRTTNPMRGPNKFKLGVFSANCDGGLTMSLAPERWPANWDDIAAMCQIADQAGMEFILPVAKWRGYQGKANIYGKSFETMTHSAAIGALTKQICVFSTIHVPLVTPTFAAKAIATIDHITHGRAGLNIVCGWNQEEFDLHGVEIEQELATITDWSGTKCGRVCWRAAQSLTGMAASSGCAGSRPIQYPFNVHTHSSCRPASHPKVAISRRKPQTHCSRR